MISCVLAIRGYVGGMNWQQAVSLVIVAAAAALMVRSRFRRPKFSFQRDTHCGCSVGRGEAGHGSIVYRARRGQRPEVRVKMR